jgi:hypothetical protein
MVIPEIGGWLEQQVVQETKERKGRRALASQLHEFLDPLDPLAILGDNIS